MNHRTWNRNQPEFFWLTYSSHAYFGTLQAYGYFIAIAASISWHSLRVQTHMEVFVEFLFVYVFCCLFHSMKKQKTKEQDLANKTFNQEANSTWKQPDHKQTLWIVKVGCKCLNPSKGAREQLVTNLRSMHRSFGSNPFITCSKNLGKTKLF